MFIHLIADLSRDSGLRERFARTPRDVLSEYDVPETDWSLLREVQGNAWREKVNAELRELGYALAPTVSLPLPWPGPSELELESVKPLSVNSGAPFELTIAAEQTQEGDPIPFPPEATISLSDSATSKDYPATVNVDPKSHYRAKVIAKQVVVESAGSYSIRVCATIAGTQVTVPWTGRPLSVK